MGATLLHQPSPARQGMLEGRNPTVTGRKCQKEGREHLQRRRIRQLPVVMVVMMLSFLGGFRLTARADLYITGVDDGENTTVRFSGTLTLPPPPLNNVSVLVVEGAALHGGSSNPEADTLRLGPLGFVLVDNYAGLLQSSTPLHAIGFYDGSGFSAEAISHSGDSFDITQTDLRVGTGYESGAPLNGTTVFRGTGLPIDLDTPLTLSLAGSESKIHFNIPHLAPALRIAFPRKTYQYQKRLVVRGISTTPLSSLQTKITGSPGIKTRQLGGTITWRVQVPRRILERRRAITVRVQGRDSVGNISSVVKRRFRRR